MSSDYIPLNNGAQGAAAPEFSDIKPSTINKPISKDNYQARVEEAQLSRIQSIQTGMIATIVIFVLIVLILLAMLIFLIVSTSNGTWNYTAPNPETDSLGDKIKSLAKTEAKFVPNTPISKEIEIIEEKSDIEQEPPKKPFDYQVKKKSKPKDTPHPSKRSPNIIPKSEFNE